MQEHSIDLAVKSIEVSGSEGVPRVDDDCMHIGEPDEDVDEMTRS